MLSMEADLEEGEAKEETDCADLGVLHNFVVINGHDSWEFMVVSWNLMGFGDFVGFERELIVIQSVAMTQEPKLEVHCTYHI